MKILIIGHIWPEPQSSAAGSRMMQLISCFKQANCELHFACSAKRGERAAALEDRGLKTHKIFLNDDGFDAFAKALDPQVVLYDRFMVEEQFGWRIAEACPDAVRILDTEDLHGLRNARIAALKQGEAYNPAFLHNDIMKRELASIYRCDLSLIISEFEIDLLRKTLGVPQELLFYLPFMVKNTSKSVKNTWKSFRETQDFMSIGNFKHWPNYDGVLYLKKEIWPLIRKQLPTAKLHIYGAYPSQKVEQLHNAKEGFLIEGFIADAAKVTQQARISLAALRAGAGLKGKILEAMQNGTPCITTPIGAEAMGNPLDFNGRIAENASHFAAAAISLYQNEQEWKKAREQGFAVLEKRFSAKFWCPLLSKKVGELMKNLKNHRLCNFTGALLWHQSLQASRFMSKWIMLKNEAEDAKN